MPDPAQRPTGQTVDLDEVRQAERQHLDALAGALRRLARDAGMLGREWIQITPADAITLLADLDAARTALAEAEERLDLDAWGKLTARAERAEAERDVAREKVAEQFLRLGALTVRAERAEANARSLADQLMREEADNARNGEARNLAEAAIERVRARHQEHEGRCVACVEWCDCLDRVKELGDDWEVARAARLCTHGNVPWPCPTVAALDSTDPVEDAPEELAGAQGEAYWRERYPALFPGTHPDVPAPGRSGEEKP